MNIPKVPIGEILNINERIYLGTINGNVDITQKKDYFFVIGTKNEIINLAPEDRNTKNLYFSLNDCFVYSFVGGIEDVNIKPIVMNVNCFSEDTQSAKFWYNTTEGSLKYRNALNKIIDLNAIALSEHTHSNMNYLKNVSGINTGDETRASIINKIGFEVSPEGHSHSDILGNAVTADKLKVPISINGIAFDGSKDIVINPSNIIWNDLFRTTTDSEKDYWNNKQGKDTNLSAILALEEPNGILRKNGVGSWSLDNSEYALISEVMKTTGDQSVSGTKTFDGDVHINGSIYQQGALYETHAEKVYTKNDFIVLRDGAISGLSTGYTGIIAKLYDGVNDGQLVFDVNGIARVGDIGNAQAIATREDNPVNGKVPIWNNTSMRFETANSPTTIAGFGIADAITTAGEQTIDGALTLSGLLTANATKAFSGNYTNYITIGESASSVTGYKMNMHSTSGQSMVKFTTTTTGQAATDGLDIGIGSTGDAEVRFRENGHICFYIKNALHTAFYNGGPLLTVGEFSTYGGVLTPKISIKGDGNSIGADKALAITRYSLNAYTASANQSMFKFTNSITGQTVTDGTDVGITDDGSFEIKQRENKPLNIYTNNALAATFGEDKTVTLPSLAGTGNRTVVADSTGKLVADVNNPPSVITYQPYNYTAVYGINYINSGTGGQIITLPLAIEGYSVELLSKTQGANTFLSTTGTNKIYDINGNDVTSTYTAAYSLASIKRIKFVASKQIERTGAPLNSGVIDWVVVEREDNLAGTGNRMVVADPAGNLSATEKFRVNAIPLINTSGEQNVALMSDYDISFHWVSNTSLRINMKGDDGVMRSTTLTLS